ncbi:MAG: tRNA lysidine(34) synthetase TilS, partial [Kiritimatiellia bacterium]
MLHLLHRRLDPVRSPLVVAHFHHEIRGNDADADARFVETLAQSLGLRCIVGRADVPAAAAASGESLEMAARRLRHAFLQRTAAAEGCAAIATGHTADDQIETLLLRLARGTSLRGVGGIQPVSTPRPGGIPVFRPLLGLRHAQIRKALEAAALPWREDATNAAIHAAARNIVRHRVVSAFEQALGPAAVPSTLRSMAVFREDDAFLQSLADAAAKTCIHDTDGLSVAALQAQPTALFRRIVATWLYNAGLGSAHVSLTALNRIATLCDGPEAGTRDATLGGGWIIRRCNGVLAALPPKPQQDAATEGGSPLEKTGARVFQPVCADTDRNVRAPLGEKGAAPSLEKTGARVFQPVNADTDRNVRAPLGEKGAAPSLEKTGARVFQPVCADTDRNVR